MILGLSSGFQHWINEGLRFPVAGQGRIKTVSANEKFLAKEITTISDHGYKGL